MANEINPQLGGAPVGGATLHKYKRPVEFEQIRFKLKGEAG